MTHIASCPDPLDGPTPTPHDDHMTTPREPLPALDEAGTQWVRDVVATAPPLTEDMARKLRPIVEGTVAPRETGQRDAS